MKNLLIALMLMVGLGAYGQSINKNAFTTNVNPAAIPVPGLVAANLVPSGAVYTNATSGELNGAGVFQLSGLNTGATYVLIPGTNTWETTASPPGTGISDFAGSCDSGANTSPLVFTPCSSTMYVYFNAAASIGSSNVSAQVYKLNVATAFNNLYANNLTAGTVSGTKVNATQLITPPGIPNGYGGLIITNGELSDALEAGGTFHSSFNIQDSHGDNHGGTGAEWRSVANQWGFVVPANSHWQFGISGAGYEHEMIQLYASYNANSTSNFTSHPFGFQNQYTNAAHGLIDGYWITFTSNYDATLGNSRMYFYAAPTGLTASPTPDFTLGPLMLTLDSAGIVDFGTNLIKSGFNTVSSNFTVGGNLTVSGNTTIGINANVQGSLIIGNPTNTATGTLIQTNFISGKLYTNIYGRPISISANATLTTAGVSGNSSLALLASGYLTNYSGLSTIVTSIASSYTNVISMVIPASQTYTFTNTSAGAGDSASVTGGQILVQ